MGNGTEPYVGRHLARVLEGCGGVERHSKGAGRRIFCMPNGAEIACPLPNDPVPTYVARAAAERLGKSWPEFRSAVGYPVIQAGRGRVVSRQQSTGCTKREVIERIADVRKLLAEVERAVRPGIRDSAFYGRVHVVLVDTAVLAGRAVATAEKKGTE